MKVFSNSLSYLLCIGMGLFCSPAKLPAQILDWTFENIIDDVQQSGANPDAVQDANGNLHVSYWQAGEDRLKYGKRDALTGTWTHETLDVGDNFHGYNSAIALDANGFVHIAYVKRIQANAQIRYISNKSGSWQVEIPLPNDHIGKYGRDLEFPIYAQASLDIFFQADGNPVILYFDAKVAALGRCGSVITDTYLDYNLDMNMVVRLNDGTWEYGPFEDIPDRRGQGCLLDGDRFGEFCQMLTTSDNRYFALSNSLHNHDLLLFSSPDLINWNLGTVDSSERFFNVINDTYFREGFEFIDADMVGDTSIHMVYGVSNHYGNGRVFDSRRPFFYTRFHPDSIGMPGYQGFHREIGTGFGIYRSFSSIKALSADTLFISFYELNNNVIKLGSSFNGGLNWTYETVDLIQTNTFTHLFVEGDSIQVLAYDSSKDRMVLYKKSIAGTNWVSEIATQSEQRGSLISSRVTRTGNIDKKQIVFKEEIEETIHYASATNGAWNFEEVVSNAVGVESLALDLDASDNPVFVYSNDNTEQLRIVSKQATWNNQLVIGSSKARNLNFLIDNGTYHIAYFELNTGHLHYLVGTSLSGPWNLTVVDSSSNIVGRALDMAQESNGTLHLSYQDVINPKVKHAILAPGNSWQIENITPVFNFNPNFTSIAINAQDLPSISFHDGTTNKIHLVENDGTGWTLTEVIGQGGNIIGTPMELLIDDQDRPWILYNISDILEEVALVRRGEFGTWNQVSINNNSAEIAQNFDFHLVGEDFYLIGKKNQLSNNGLGLLFAQKGVKTSIPELQLQTALSLAPNPTRKALEVHFENPKPQKVSLELYNLNGQLVHLLQEPTLLTAGSHTSLWELPSLDPGVYIFLWKSETYQIPQKLIVLP